jgi:transposase
MEHAFDVSKASLSLHILPSGETLSLQNDGAAIRRLLKREQKRNRKQGLGPMLVICEATGGYEDAVLKTASELGLDCHRAHGSGVRAYAKFRGRHAKNDPIDAALIAEYGRDKPDLELYQPPRPEEAALRALMGRRTELKDMIQAETCRIEHASLKAVRVSLESHLAALKDQLALIEKDIRALTRRDEAFNKRSRLMQRPASGPWPRRRSLPPSSRSSDMSQAPRPWRSPGSPLTIATAAMSAEKDGSSPGAAKSAPASIWPLSPPFALTLTSANLPKG